MSKSGGYVGIVEKIVLNGKHGAYAVARCEELGSVTFSLDKPVWRERSKPEEGVYVMLSDVQQKRAGWRAMRGRFVRPSDKPQPATKQPVV